MPCYNRGMTLIPMELIRLPHKLLRPVEQGSVEYLELVESLRAIGQGQSILVRPVAPRGVVLPDPFPGADWPEWLPGWEYEIVNGNWRYHAALDLGWTHIQVIIRPMDEDLYVESQFQANAVLFKTRQLDFSNYLQALIRERESAGIRTTTIRELVRITGKSEQWIKDVLSLLKLCEEATAKLAAKELTFGNAVQLARIKSLEWQRVHLPDALHEKTADFEARVSAFIRNMITDKADGHVKRREGVYQPKLRRMRELERELETLEATTALIIAKGITTVKEAQRAILDWLFSLDDKTVRGKQVQDKRNETKLNNRLTDLKSQLQQHHDNGGASSSTEPPHQSEYGYEDVENENRSSNI